MISKYSRSRKQHCHSTTRHRFVLGLIYLSLSAVIARLFYWQMLQGSWLKTAANDQYRRTITQTGSRGRIFTSERKLLVGNTFTYRLVAHPNLITDSPRKITQLIQPLLLTEYKPYLEATESSQRETIAQNLSLEIESKLNKKRVKWISIMTGLDKELKAKIDTLNITGLDFESSTTRFYPEASMAAQVTGFVAQDKQGQTVGYFGVEGALNKELAGKKRKITTTTDALGLSLVDQNYEPIYPNQGRDITLTIRRDLQHMVETELKKGVTKYGAKSGEIVVLDPHTGQILALAALPQYDQKNFYQYDTKLYKNPLLVDLFEPGSIMKTLTVAIGIDTHTITPDTPCPRCEGPVKIDKYSIKTWDNKYHPQITMNDALAKSDNTAMVYIAQEVGKEKFQQYLKKFGIGEAVGVELQGDRQTPFPTKWGPVELATRSFGQGISTTSLQIAKAVAAIANHGKLMKTQIIKSVSNPDGTKIEVKPKAIRQVISKATAAQVTQMMVHAAKDGEAKWTYSKTHAVAGKTGTSQIPSKNGGYKENATIASFIGFAPPEDPKFLMLVKLIEPQASPWAAETAAPLWYKIADKLFLSLNIPPDHQ